MMLLQGQGNGYNSSFKLLEYTTTRKLKNIECIHEVTIPRHIVLMLLTHHPSSSFLLWQYTTFILIRNGWHMNNTCK